MSEGFDAYAKRCEELRGKIAAAITARDALEAVHALMQFTSDECEWQAAVEAALARVEGAAEEGAKG